MQLPRGQAITKSLLEFSKNKAQHDSACGWHSGSDVLEMHVGHDIMQRYRAMWLRSASKSLQSASTPTSFRKRGTLPAAFLLKQVKSGWKAEVCADARNARFSLGPDGSHCEAHEGGGGGLCRARHCQVLKVLGSRTGSAITRSSGSLSTAAVLTGRPSASASRRAAAGRPREPWHSSRRFQFARPQCTTSRSPQQGSTSLQLWRRRRLQWQLHRKGAKVRGAWEVFTWCPVSRCEAGIKESRLRKVGARPRFPSFPATACRIQLN